MKWLQRGTTLLGLLLASTAAQSQVASSVSFKADLQPLLNARCVVCHVTGAENGNLNLARSVARARLVSVQSAGAPLPLVVPGKPDESYLMHKLLGAQATVGGEGTLMPPTGALDAAQIQLFRAWIEQGAQDN